MAIPTGMTQREYNAYKQKKAAKLAAREESHNAAVATVSTSPIFKNGMTRREYNDYKAVKTAKKVARDDPKKLTSTQIAALPVGSNEWKLAHRMLEDKHAAKALAQSIKKDDNHSEPDNSHTVQSTHSDQTGNYGSGYVSGGGTTSTGSDVNSTGFGALLGGSGTLIVIAVVIFFVMKK